MTRKILEICYDLATSNEALRTMGSRRARAFRDAAERVVGRALVAADLGGVVGSDAGFGEVRLRLWVTDFEAAENVIRRATLATPFGAFREVLCYWDAPTAA